MLFSFLFVCNFFCLFLTQARPLDRRVCWALLYIGKPRDGVAIIEESFTYLFTSLEMILSHAGLYRRLLPKRVTLALGVPIFDVLAKRRM